MKFNPLRQGKAISSTQFSDVEPIEVPVTVRIGNQTMTLKEAASIQKGSLIPLGKKENEPFHLVLNGKPVAKGKLVVMADQELALQVTEISSA